MSDGCNKEDKPLLPPIHVDGVVYKALADKLQALCAKWKRRALAFQEGYKDKSFEVTALEIQKMDLLAHGADKVVMRQNESLKTKLLAVCVERNEAREALRGLLRDHKCWCQTWVGGEHEPECIAATAALGVASRTKE